MAASFSAQVVSHEKLRRKHEIAETGVFTG